MKVPILLGAAALLLGPAVAAQPRPSLADDVADVATRICFEVVTGRLRWDPANLDEEAALFARMGLKVGIPGGALDGFGPRVASTFNQAVLGSRSRGASHVLLAVGGRTPGCRVTVAGAPGIVAAAEVAAALQSAPHGWTAAPHLDRDAGPIERHSFVRRDSDGRVALLDLLVAKPAEGNFRMMAMVLPAPPGLELPDGF